MRRAVLLATVAIGVTAAAVTAGVAWVMGGLARASRIASVDAQSHETGLANPNGVTTAVYPFSSRSVAAPVTFATGGIVDLQKLYIVGERGCSITFLDPTVARFQRGTA